MCKLPVEIIERQTVLYTLCQCIDYRVWQRFFVM